MLHRIVIVLAVSLVAVFFVHRWMNSGGMRAPESSSTAQYHMHEPHLRVVNVLDKHLYDDAHIAGSIQVPFERVEQEAASWNKEVPVVFYCANYQCSASGEAARMLQDKGFAQVYAYEGGTAEWFQLSQADSKYKIQGPAQEAYLRQPNEPVVHTQDGDIKVLTAAELYDMMEAARQ